VPPEEEAAVSMEPMFRPKSMPMSSMSMSMLMLYESMLKRSYDPLVEAPEGGGGGSWGVESEVEGRAVSRGSETISIG